ncbi:hypothetical protein [Frondihabitans cladoniiphilus]|uniref:Uncharacterized protein n=1 Tax=Frondihabitans cladoniiphilus TaxID=715785 RepID=A0ABP8W4H9_9MICO
MAKFRVVVSDKALAEVFEQIATAVSEADASFRSTHEGYPEEIVRADAASALPIDLTGEGVDAYALAMATGQDFEFQLGG